MVRGLLPTIGSHWWQLFLFDVRVSAFDEVFMAGGNDSKINVIRFLMKTVGQLGNLCALRNSGSTQSSQRYTNLKNVSSSPFRFMLPNAC